MDRELKEMTKMMYESSLSKSIRMYQPVNAQSNKRAENKLWKKENYR